MGAVLEEGGRELAAGIRSGRIQERDRRQGGAEARRGSRLESRGRALFGHPLAAVHDRERVGPAHSRSTLGRDSRDRHPVLPQRDEPLPQLVLRPGRGPRSARADAAAARRLDGTAGRVRRGPRSRPYPGVPAQHEGELDVSDRTRPRREVGQGERPHPDPDGLLALQLRRPAGRQDRGRRSDPEDRTVRQVGHDVGLQAGTRRHQPGGREEDAG